MEEGRWANTVPEVSLLVMRCAAAVVNRGVLLSVIEDSLHGIGQFGLQIADGQANERIRNIRIPVDQQSVFQQVLNKKIPFKGKLKRCWWNDYLVHQLGGVFPEDVIAVPMMVNGEVERVFYGDNLPDRAPVGCPEIIEMLMLYAGIEMEKMALTLTSGRS